MIASTIAEYEKALESLAILPLLLGAIAAYVTYRFDTQPDGEKNTKKKAFWTFLISGVGGTIVALMSVVSEQESAEAAQAQASQFSTQLQTATNMLASVTGQLQSATNSLSSVTSQLTSLQAQIAEIAEFMTNNPDQVVQNNNYYNTVSKTFANLHQVLVTLNITGNPAQREANQMLQNRIENASQFLSSYRIRANQDRLNTPRVPVLEPSKQPGQRNTSTPETPQGDRELESTNAPAPPTNLHVIGTSP